MNKKSYCKQIGEVIGKIAKWTQTAPRRLLVPQPVIHAERRHSLLRKNELAPRDNSSKKLKHFKSSIRIIDGQAEIDSATTDQAESMYKTIKNMRQGLDKYDD